MRSRRPVRRSLRSTIAALAALLIALPAIAIGDSNNGGWNGQTPPDNPNYDPGEQNPLNACVNQEEWFLYSFIPECTPLAHDPQDSAGMFVDQSWKQFTIGRPDVVIAYMEAGINWHDSSARAALAPRGYLNAGELPYPELADGKSCGRYDCNGDGTFNVFDYAQDPRIHKPYINGSLTPEDLIAAFGDCSSTSALTRSSCAARVTTTTTIATAIRMTSPAGTSCTAMTIQLRVTVPTRIPTSRWSGRRQRRTTGSGTSGSAPAACFFRSRPAPKLSTGPTA
jgi:hypothetical protein